MKRILWHNLSINYPNPPRGLYNFDQRALLFAEPGDVVVTRTRPHRAFLSFLEGVGLPLSSIRFLWSSETAVEGPTAVVDHTRAVNQLRALTQVPGTAWELDSFMFSELENKLCEQLGIIPGLNPEHYSRFGTKSAFRTLVRRTGLALPRGYVARGPASAAAAALWLTLFRNVEELVFKQDEGVAGLGSLRISGLGDSKNFMQVAQFLLHKQAWGIGPGRSSRWVVEEWLRDVVVSPSVQMFVRADGSIEHISTHVQLFHEDRMRYQGCLSVHWLDDVLRDQVEKEARLLAERLSYLGYRGHLGFNAVALTDGRIVWTEVNPRRVASSYPFRVFQRLKMLSKGDRLYMAKNVERIDWRGFGVEQILDGLKDSLYRPQTRRGLIPLDFSLTESCGIVTIMAIAETKEETFSLMKHAQSC